MSNASVVEQPLLVIRASAGSGKTFQLSNRYLRLIHADAPITEILATTFTRKAAGEILERILVRLGEAADDAGAATELAAFLGAADLSQQRCGQLLGRLTGQLHRLRVGTLDRFFAQLARSHSAEMQLPPRWQITDEIVADRVRDQAIDEILESDSTDDVARLLHLINKGEADRSVHELVRKTIDNLYALFLVSDEKAWDCVDPPSRKKADELAAAIEAVAALSFTDKRFINARDANLDAARAEDWEKFIGKGLAAKLIAGDDRFGGKEISAEIRAAYGPLIEHAEAVMLGQLANQTKATFGLLQKFDAKMLQLKSRSGGIRFEDVTRALARNVAEKDVDTFAFRMDGRIGHLLLDEFQDTSTEQWQVLRRFAQRITERPDGSFFCVGDAKQAIYGWRGGVAEIFESLEEDIAELETDQLEKSYRSAPAVIDVVNKVFQNLTQHDNLDDFGKPVRDWQKHFPAHQTNQIELKGHVTLETAPVCEEGQEQRVATLRYAARRVAELVQQSPNQQIGVLVRRNKAVARLIFELRQLGVQACEEGGNPLTDSAAVQLILSLARIADHPGDTVAWYHVACSPLAAPLDVRAEADETERATTAARIRRQLLEQGYANTIGDWARLLLPHCSRREASRLEQLQALTIRYAQDATLRPSDFVTFAERQKAFDTESANVQVMTIHQAKGLEFDVVVLPELDTGIIQQNPSCAVELEEPTGRVKRVCIYRNKDIQKLLPPRLRRPFEKTKVRNLNEDLCMLYVAMTRAVHDLHMIIAPSKPNEQSMPKSFAGLLRAALVGTTRVDANKSLYNKGDTDWFQTLGNAKSESTVADEQLAVVVPPIKEARSRGLESTSPSQLEGTNDVRLGDIFETKRSTAMARGTLVHAWFEQIEWLDEGLPARSDLEQVARQLESTGLDVDQVLDDFYASLAHERVQQVLTRNSYRAPRDLPFPTAVLEELSQHDFALEVRCEQPIAFLDDDKLVTGSIDRLVLMKNGDSVLAADIIDFKTDAVDAGDEAALTAKVEHYRPQLEAYRAAVARMFQLSKDRAASRLLFVDAATVRSVGHTA